ncbi:MAG TPA: adenylate/guanylate cyclase domain-containing protein [Burkholderiales bacterium]|nr:adenylate/guanylate cyclase domain-containing protein [Burkholderiales bacterium]
MISSKDLLEKTGISRATLNNYISAGLLSKPLVQQVSGESSGPKLLGYFPDSALERIELIQQLKKEGLSMGEIIARFGAEKPAEARPEPVRTEAPARPADRPGAGPAPAPAAAGARPLHLTIDELSYPAYMVNHSFELTWYNDPAREKFLGRFEQLPPNSEARNLFLMLLQASGDKSANYQRELLQPHLAFAKDRVSKASLLSACRTLDPERVQLIDALYGETKTCPGEGIVESSLELRDEDGNSEHWHFYAAFFREGILFIYVPNGPAGPTLLDFLARRNQVIRDLLRRRLPVLTPLAVLVADLQNSVKICSELPPEEYFELINEMWSTMGPIFRRYYGTHGKHVGDGMVYYFFPQPDSNYIFNAICCAHEIKIAMRKISKDWQLRKNWFNELYLNTGLNEGQEWLGTFQSATAIEFAVLGDTINHAGRLSDFARYGAVWATKAFLSRLSPEERARIEFGIVRRGDGNREQFVASSYAQLGSLVDLTSERYEKLREIATLPICEIRSVGLVRKATA